MQRSRTEQALGKDNDIAYLPGPSGDRALVARLLRGEEQAMAELYQAHAPRLLRFLQRFLRDGALAEDALQEAFISAFENLPRLQAVESVQAWLLRIAVRKALNLRRSSSRRVRSESQEPRPEGAPFDPATRDLAQKLLELLLQLDPAKHLVLALVANGYTAAEIAASTEEPRSTVLSRIVRARLELARLAAAAGLELPQLKEEPAP